nr:copii coat assembly sec16 [Ipomoea batatas]
MDGSNPRRAFSGVDGDWFSDQQQLLQAGPKYLVTFTVGYNQKDNIDAAVKKCGVFYSFLCNSMSLLLVVFDLSGH